MFRRFLRTSLWLTTFTALAACVTVNIYFPAAKVSKAADTIVDDIYSPDEKEQKGTGEQNSLLMNALYAMGAALTPTAAHAEDATSISNAAIRGLKAQMEQNHGQLAPFYASGNIGISKDGSLALRNTDGLPMKQLASLKRLVSAENGLRKSLYAEVAKALDTTEVGKVQGIFAEKWRSHARQSWWIQDNSGRWLQK